MLFSYRIQNAEKGQGQMAVVTNLIRSEGVFSLWKGFLPYYARLGPHTVLTFIFLEQMNATYFRYVSRLVSIVQGESMSMDFA